MRLKQFAAIFLILLLLPGCAKTAESRPTQPALDFRTALMDGGGCAFTARVTADYGSRVYDFTLDCSYTAGEGAALTVTEPELLAGISASVSANGAQVEFDGVGLDFGQLANGHVAPMALPWLLGDCWTGAYIDSAGPDSGLERITYLHGYNDAELTLDTWLEGGVPVRCEVTWDGTRCLTAALSDFQFGPR